VWYCVPVPSMNQGWFALLASRTASVTGVPVALVAPEPSSRVANVSGWLSLSVPVHVASLSVALMCR
jgi:hypothetical protein